MVENVEFFLVAAIVILGLRAYFVQPFKIPTNSMWPSYYGMTASGVYKAGEEPGLLRKAARLVTLGASNYSVTAPADGEILFPVFASTYGMRPAYSEKSGRSLLVFPTMLREYTFMVGGVPAKLTVPAEFDNDFQGVLDEAFKGQAPTLYDALKDGATKNKPLQTSTVRVQGREVTVYWIPLGRQVRKGENILSFDILTGDLLFVDRLSYNFIKPPVGSGFVFKTGNIAALNQADSNYEGDKYFVKRLVGTPGDTIEIKAPALYRNGKPIEGAEAFGKNARKEGLYPGYTNNTGGPTLADGIQTSDGMLPLGGKVIVPAHSFFALGDNSPRSKDSRYWGFVPDKDVVGRPLFIYYPLTSRWGPAK
jgi:signal peptidase I